MEDPRRRANKCAFSGKDPFKQKTTFPSILRRAYSHVGLAFSRCSHFEGESSWVAIILSRNASKYCSLAVVIKCFASYTVFGLSVFLCLIRNDTTIGSVACYHR